MADEEFGDLNLTQYSLSGRWSSRNPNSSWMRYSHGSSHLDGLNTVSNVPDRFSTSKTNSYDNESTASFCTRTPSSGQNRGKSGLYYSPPGTSYTIIERPVATTSIGQQYTEMQSAQKYSPGYSQSHILSHSPRSKVSGTKRSISPEDVLNLFGSTTGKGKPSIRKSQSPMRSPLPTDPYLYQNTHDDAIIKTVTMVRQPESSHGFGICVKGGKNSGRHFYY